jgi:hypothetical protein
MYEDSGTSEPLTRKALLLREFQEKLICKAQQTTYDAADRDKKNATSETVETFSVPQEEDAQLFLSVEETLKYAKLFSEEFKLEKMPTRALLVCCFLNKHAFLGFLHSLFFCYIKGSL